MEELGFWKLYNKTLGSSFYKKDKTVSDVALGERAAIRSSVRVLFIRGAEEIVECRGHAAQWFYREQMND